MLGGCGSRRRDCSSSPGSRLGKSVARSSAHRPAVSLAAPVGPVFVAWSPLTEVEAWIERATGDSAEGPDFYYTALREVRERGFAVNLVPMRGSALAETIEQARGAVAESPWRVANAGGTRQPPGG